MILMLNIFQFQSGRHFEVAVNILIESDTGSWTCQQDSQEHFLDYESVIDAISHKLKELLLFNYFVLNTNIFVWRVMPSCNIIS